MLSNTVNQIWLFKFGWNLKTIGSLITPITIAITCWNICIFPLGTLSIYFEFICLITICWADNTGKAQCVGWGVGKKGILQMNQTLFSKRLWYNRELRLAKNVISASQSRDHRMINTWSVNDQPRDHCMRSQVVSSCSATWSVHDSPMLSACQSLITAW